MQLCVFVRVRGRGRSPMPKNERTSLNTTRGYKTGPAAAAALAAGLYHKLLDPVSGCLVTELMPAAICYMLYGTRLSIWAIAKIAGISDSAGPRCEV
jgi:hypothetical protein